MNDAINAVTLCQELVRIQSVNPGGCEDKCAQFLGDLLLGGGFEVTYHDFAPGRTSVVARKGGSRDSPRLCFAGHIDTVPLGFNDWSVEPYGGNIVEDKLYGRGATDMKSGIASFVAAAMNLGDELLADPGVLLIMAAGEETGCEGSLALGQELANFVRVGAMIIAEPTYNRPMVGHRGALWLRMTTTGKTAHGSMPELGVNALYKAARATQKLEDFGFNVTPHPHLGGNSLSVGNLHAGQNVNSVPDHAVIEVDIRTIPGVRHDRLLEGFRAYLEGDIEEIEPFVNLSGVWTDPHHPWVERVYALCAARDGERPAIAALPFFTDASALQPAFGGVPTVILGPGETHMAHQTDEYCVVDNLPAAVSLYKALWRDYLMYYKMVCIER